MDQAIDKRKKRYQLRYFPHSKKKNNLVVNFGPLTKK